MKKTELRNLVREAIEEVMKEFAPLGVADESRLDEKAPPHFPRALEKKLLAQYKDTPQKAYATMWKIHKAKNEGNERVCEMWTAWENKKDENSSSEVDHDETDLNNPEEKKEVDLAKQIKKLADQLLSMHGVEDDESEEDSDESGDTEVDIDDSDEEDIEEKKSVQEKKGKK